MKLLRNMILIFAMTLLIGFKPAFASTKNTSLTSSSSPVKNTISSFVPIIPFTQSKASILLQVNAGLKFNSLGFAQMNTRVLISNDSNYVKIKMQLQRYKNKKWSTITTDTHTGKGLTGYS